MKSRRSQCDAFLFPSATAAPIGLPAIATPKAVNSTVASMSKFWLTRALKKGCSWLATFCQTAPKGLLRGNAQRGQWYCDVNTGKWAFLREIVLRHSVAV